MSLCWALLVPGGLESVSMIIGHVQLSMRSNVKVDDSDIIHAYQSQETFNQANHVSLPSLSITLTRMV